MYIKIAGCLLVLAGAAAIGYWKAEGLKLRVQRMEGLKQMILFLQGELRFYHATLSEAFESVSKRVEKPFSMFLEETAKKLEGKEMGGLEQVWNDAEETLVHIEGFQKKDLEILGLLRTGLGYLDMEMQTETLNLAMIQTELAIKEARVQQELKGKLYQTMGVTVGALLALLIV